MTYVQAAVAVILVGLLSPIGNRILLSLITALIRFARRCPFMYR